MIIERTKNEVIFKLPSSINLDDLQSIADLLEFKNYQKNLKQLKKTWIVSLKLLNLEDGIKPRALFKV